MTCKVAVTFEYPVRAPETWRGEITAISPAKVVWRAVHAAKLALKPNQWSSLVVVILERAASRPRQLPRPKVAIHAGSDAGTGKL